MSLPQAASDSPFDPETALLVQKLMKFAKRRWVWLIVLALFAFAAYSVYWFWDDPSKAAMLSSFFGFAATVLLVGITSEYVRTNQRMLNLNREQWEQQNEIEVWFGVSAYRGKARVWVANLGLPTVIIVKAVVAVVAMPGPDNKLVAVHKSLPLKTGEKGRFMLPETLWENQKHRSVIEVTLHYESTTKRRRRTRAYTLSVANDKVVKVRRGIHMPWSVGCPKCKRLHLCFMNTKGLRKLAQAYDREKEMQMELSSSCPNHHSRWLLTLESDSKRALS